MVNIHYDRRQCTLTVRGHAGSAPKGKDLVCAGVSALVLTLATNVAEMAAAEQVHRPVLSLRQGDTRISCVPSFRLRQVTVMIFDAVCSGFGLLQRLYPEHIHYTVSI